jgi:hypothetical protein
MVGKKLLQSPYDRRFRCLDTVFHVGPVRFQHRALIEFLPLVCCILRAFTIWCRAPTVNRPPKFHFSGFAAALHT